LAHRDGTSYRDGCDAETPPKNQNSTIHLLEAFTTLYEVVPETPRLRDRLEELLVITRGTVTTDRSMLKRPRRWDMRSTPRWLSASRW
jgi:hypothetical protein